MTPEPVPPDDAHPLTGRVVVVTRAGEQAGRFSELLREAGAQVLEVPLISTDDPPDRGAALQRTLAELARFDWVVVTSPNGARRVAAVLGDRAVRTATRFAVIGRGTEAALGRPADLVPGRHVAEGLLAEFPAGTGRVLLVQGDLARPVLADGLVAVGWQVERVVAYRTVAVRPSEGLLRQIASADAITFASGSAVRSFVDATGGTRLPEVVVSIGPITTAVATELGVPVSHTADDHTLPGLVAAVVTALRRPPAPIPSR